MDIASFLGFESLFATRLRNLVEQKNISKQQLADEIGVSRQAVSQYCDGSTIPNADKLLRLAEYFNVSLDYLVGRTENVTTDKDTQFVCDYTGLNEKAVEALHNSALESNSEWMPISKEFLNMLIQRYSFDLCGFAQRYKNKLKETIEAKETFLKNSGNDEISDNATQRFSEAEDNSKLALFYLQEAFDELVDLFAKDEKARNQELDNELLRNHFYIYRYFDN